MGDEADFATLPARTQTAAAAAWFGAEPAARDGAGDGFEACGSPGEVHDEPTLGARFTRYVATTSDPHLQDEIADAPYNNPHGKQMAWIARALGADDQLRQRVAWALAQVLVVGANDGDRENEVWHAFYDIFVRHAFGNYRDVLREIAYSPLMGDCECPAVSSRTRGVTPLAQTPSTPEYLLTCKLLHHSQGLGLVSAHAQI